MKPYVPWYNKAAKQSLWKVNLSGREWTFCGERCIFDKDRTDLPGVFVAAAA